ncbi:bifunctional adenosylcobinamide kinase/adenosylcobinamide-phosphate guanylyltransferase [Mariniluteicoccus flavus]
MPVTRGGAQRVLVTGGVRSGKSRHAESLLAGLSVVTYVAPGHVPDPVADSEWAARVAAHQQGRPVHWRTLETADVVGALRAATTPLIVDCLGTWLTRQLDDLGAWDSRTDWEAELQSRIDHLAHAWRACDQTLVGVTNEVGWGLVSEHRSGRVFADWLGRTNQTIAEACDEVHLVVAGRVLVL